MRVLGIDPGAGHTGWAIVDLPERTIFRIGTVRKDNWAETLEGLKIATAGYSGLVSLVAVNVPAKSGEKAAFFDRSGKKSPMAIVKNGVTSGEAAGYFLGLGYRVVKVTSKPRHGLKMNAKLWARYWGHDGRCSEDARDAAQIALIGAEEAK